MATLRTSSPASSGRTQVVNDGDRAPVEDPPSSYHPSFDQQQVQYRGEKIKGDRRKKAGLTYEEDVARPSDGSEEEGDMEKVYVYQGVAEGASRSSFDVRIRGFTFAWFTICMATAGLAIVLGRIPDAYRFRGLDTIGRLIFVIDLVLFVVFHGFLAKRFYLYPRAFKTMLLHPVESSYLCAWLQACATILVASEIYGITYTGHWLVKALLVLWIIDFALAIALAMYLPIIHFVDHPHAHKDMPPSFMLLPTVVIYATTVGYELIPQVSPVTGIWIFWVCYMLLGLGMLLSIFYLALWFTKLLSGGLYEGNHALTPFMIIGMTSYTAGGFFGLATTALHLFPQLSNAIGEDYLPSTGSVNGALVYASAGSTFHMVNLCLGMLFYGFTWWCLLVSITMSAWVVYRRKASPSLSAMFSGAFPTTGIIIDTWDVAQLVGYNGRASGARWLDIVGLVMVVIWILVYFAAIGGTVYKISKQRLLWEGKDDNKPGLAYVGEFIEIKRRKQSHEEA